MSETNHSDQHCSNCGEPRVDGDLFCTCGHTRPDDGWSSIPLTGEALPGSEWVLGLALSDSGPVRRFHAHAPAIDQRDPPRDGVASLVPDPGLREEVALRSARLDELRHWAFCPVHAHGWLRGMPYRVDALPPGQSARLFLAREAITLDEALQVGITLAEALAEMHSHGLVHGHLCLDTVHLVRSKKGVVPSLAGIPVVRASPGDWPAAPPPLALAPEVVTGHDPDPRSDLWGLGQVLVCMLRSSDKADLPAVEATVTRGSMRGLLDRLVDSDPARRPLSATEVHANLRRLLVARRHGTVPTPLVVGPVRAELVSEARTPALVAQRSTTPSPVRRQPTTPTPVPRRPTTPTPVPRQPMTPPPASLRQRWVLPVLALQGVLIVLVSLLLWKVVAVDRETRPAGDLAQVDDVTPALVGVSPVESAPVEQPRDDDIFVLGALVEVASPQPADEPPPPRSAPAEASRSVDDPPADTPSTFDGAWRGTASGRPVTFDLAFADDGTVTGVAHVQVGGRNFDRPLGGRLVEDGDGHILTVKEQRGYQPSAFVGPLVDGEVTGDVFVSNRKTGTFEIRLDDGQAQAAR